MLIAVVSAADADAAACGQPVTTGDKPTTTDCLFVLRTAVGTRECADCVCDIDDSGKVVTTDALYCLRRAVGQSISFHCPECAEVEIVPLLDDARISGVAQDENFQRVSVEFDARSETFAEARLVVDLDSTCFPFPENLQDPPDDCDEWDRLFDITVDPPTSVADPPAIVVAQAVTPYGGDRHLEIDIVDLINGLTGTHTMSFYIGTIASGFKPAAGWNVSAHLELLPGPAPRQVLAILPLVFESYGSGTTIEADFDVPAGAGSARLEYRATGHGSVNDPDDHCSAEEFCRRTHHVRIDGEEVHETPLQPWRETCPCTVAHHTSPSFDYCQENPWGVMAAVSAGRANWCPGDVSQPLVWSPAAAASAGEHELSVAVDGVVPGGIWRVSAQLYLYVD